MTATEISPKVPGPGSELLGGVGVGVEEADNRPDGGVGREVAQAPVGEGEGLR